MNEQGGLPLNQPSERHLDDCRCTACLHWYQVMTQEPRIHGRCRVCHEPIDIHPTPTCEREYS